MDGAHYVPWWRSTHSQSAQYILFFSQGGRGLSRPPHAQLHLCRAGSRPRPADSAVLGSCAVVARVVQLVHEPVEREEHRRDAAVPHPRAPHPDRHPPEPAAPEQGTRSEAPPSRQPQGWGNPCQQIQVLASPELDISPFAFCAALQLRRPTPSCAVLHPPADCCFVHPPWRHLPMRMFRYVCRMTSGVPGFLGARTACARGRCGWRARAACRGCGAPRPSSPAFRRVT